MTPSIHIRLLGVMDVRRDGAPVRGFESRKSLALLAYLICAGQPVQRAQLADLFWGDMPEARGRRNLSRELSVLGRLLPGVIEGDYHTVRFATSPDVWVDARAVEELLAEPGADGHAERAIELLRGEFMAGFLLDGCPDFELWLVREQEAWRRRQADVLGRALQGDVQRRDFARADAHARRWLAIEPWREEAHRALMRALAETGQRAAALAQFEACAKALERELGVLPSPETEALFDRIRAGWPSAAVARDAEYRHNLPRPLSPLIGRDELAAQITRQLEAARLITLTGTGGMGKTRLALKVAWDALERFPDGVWWVEFGALSDAAAVPDRLAAALGVRDAAARPTSDALAGHLRSQRALLVFDNCEHLVDACAVLAHHLLSECEDVRILATSLEPLRVSGEAVRPVPPLPVPERSDALREPDLLRFDSARLFVDRARGARPDYAIGPDDAVAIAEICRRLDGLPLAIELAAARVHVLTPREIEQRLSDRFSLLSSGARGGQPRHQTLRAALDWGHELLSGDEQFAFRQLGVFAGDFALDAAEAVIGRPEPALDMLSHLVDKSFVSVDRASSGMRFRLLETVRSYAIDRLRAAGEEGAARARHFEHFRRLAGRAERHFTGPAQMEWFDRIEGERAEVAAALEWGFAERLSGALDLVASLGRFWHVRGHVVEGYRWTQRAIETMDGAPAATQATVLRWAGAMARLTGDYARARRMLETSLALQRGQGARGPVAYALISLGLLFDDQGDYAAARDHYAQALRAFEDLGDTWGAAIALNNVGSAALSLGDADTARELCERSVRLMRGLNDERHLAQLLETLGSAALGQGDTGAARRHLRESVELHRRVGDRDGAAKALLSLASTSLAMGELRTAEGQALEAVEALWDLRERRGVALGLDVLARVAAARGAPERAARLLGAAEAARAALGVAPSPRDQRAAAEVRASASARLGGVGLAAACAEGRALTLEEAVALARGA